MKKLRDFESFFKTNINDQANNKVANCYCLENFPVMNFVQIHTFMATVRSEVILVACEEVYKARIDTLFKRRTAK